nr:MULTISPECIES: DUF983 domain-containing protein [unclassified Roseitalea]
MSDSDRSPAPAAYPALDPLKTGPRGLCPRCGVGRIFTGFLKIKPQCPHCGLDLGFADTGDGPAFFVICFTCIPVAAFTVWMEVGAGAPLWLNALLTLPLLVIFCVLPLRPLKGWMIAQQYRHEAGEGVWADKPNIHQNRGQ